MSKLYVIKAVVMVLTDKDDETVYKSGDKFDRAYMNWWDVKSLKGKEIPVCRNFVMTKENVLGYVQNLEIKSGNVVATMILDVSDPDDEITIHSYIFCVGLKNIVTEDDMKTGTIHCVGAVSKKVYPYRSEGLAAWNKIEESDKPLGDFKFKKQMEANEEARKLKAKREREKEDADKEKQETED
jgi:hypothetical protein